MFLIVFEGLIMTTSCNCSLNIDHKMSPYYIYCDQVQYLQLQYHRLISGSFMSNGDGAQVQFQKNLTKY